MLKYVPLWTIGVINGFLPNEKGLPTEYKYGAIGTATAVYVLKDIKAIPYPIRTPAIYSTMLGIPIMISMFYGGTYFGKAVRYMVDDYSVRMLKTIEELTKNESDKEKVKKTLW